MKKEEQIRKFKHLVANQYGKAFLWLTACGICIIKTTQEFSKGGELFGWFESAMALDKDPAELADDIVRFREEMHK